ncbi:hypothetical protein LTR95_005850 [Oleoguttula sp. CCFEE 5521]
MNDLQHAQGNLGDITQFLSEHSPRSVVHYHALATAELVDQILSYLDHPDLLSASNASRFFGSCIQQSARLRQKLFLQQDPTADYALLGKLIRLPFHTSIRKPRPTKSIPPASCVYTITFLLNVERWQHFQPSDRVLSMLICQPPIFAMTATVVCPCSMVSPHPEPEAVHIRSDTGHTVGDMVEVIRRLHAAHGTCGFGEPGYVDQDGSAASIVRFEGQLVLRDDDPRILEGFRPKLVLAA